MKIKNITLTLIFLILFTGCATVNKFKIILPPSWVNMNKIAPNIYVNSDMNITEQKALLKEIKVAKEYVKEIWGSVKSKPIIYACSTKKCSNSLGIGARAHHILNHLVLSKKALTKELISHEWSHSELYYRVGGFFNWRKIPTWFDEGVAVLVSHEIRHDERAWEKIKKYNLKYPSIDELITSKEWNKATKKYNENINIDNIVVTYATVGHIVKEWYEISGSEGLNELIEKVKNGYSFYN